MNRDKAYQIANFRYSLIAPIVSRPQLQPGEQKARIAEAAKKTYVIPYSTKDRVSERSIERYLRLYRLGGYEALVPRQAKKPALNSRIPAVYLEKAAALKREHQDRAISTIITLLETANEVPQGVLKRSTVYDYFRRLGLDRKTTQARSRGYQRFTPKHRNVRWQGDVCHLLYLPDTQGKKRKVYLIAWLDEYSRLITHAQCYFEEKRFTLEDTLKKALLKWGIPISLYVDNGAIYSSNHLQSICARLGMQLTHSRPYKPQGRGKSERLFDTIQRSFLPEIEVLLREQTLSLGELNEYLQLWINQHYHERTHSSTKQKPLLHFQQDTEQPLRKPDLGTLEDAFLMEEKRTPDKTAIFSLENKKYQAPLSCARQRITVRFNPHDMATVQVYQGEQRLDDACLAVIPEHVRPQPKTADPTPEHPTHLNYLKALKNAKQGNDHVSYPIQPPTAAEEEE